MHASGLHRQFVQSASAECNVRRPYHASHFDVNRRPVSLRLSQVSSSINEDIHPRLTRFCTVPHLSSVQIFALSVD